MYLSIQAHWHGCMNDYWYGGIDSFFFFFLSLSCYDMDTFT